MILQDTIATLFQASKGILAMDESSRSFTARLKALDPDMIASDATRREYRDVILMTPELPAYLSGIIFHEETLMQTIGNQTVSQYCIDNRISIGVKVDAGLTDFPLFDHEQFTLGLDGLDERLRLFFEQGVRFSKWRCVFSVGIRGHRILPSDAVIKANIHQLVHFADLSQKHNIVPMLEPEILLDGTHTIEQNADALRKVLKELFLQLETYHIDISTIILKTSMVLPGKQSGIPIDSQAVAQATVTLLRAHVPKELGGIVFLSGGQTPKQATENFNAVMSQSPFPWPMTYCFSRAIQDPALQHWVCSRNTEEIVQKIQATQDLLGHRLAMNQSARSGKYSPTEDIQ